MEDKQKLNKEQVAAIHHKKGPLLVIAGAGTGKTTVITERIKYLIEKGLARPEEILALTFTEKASREMEERIDIALPYGYANMWVLTFHSFCERILRREALQIGLDPRYKLMTSAETVQLIRTNLFKFKLSYFRPLGNPYKFIDGMIQHFSRLQDEDISTSDYLAWAKKKQKSKTKTKEEEQDKEKWLELAMAYRTYEELKVSEGLMDFGDLITKTLKLFRDRPNVLKEYQKQFKYILIDEFQDTNYSQNQLALLLAGKYENITVVGDDDQCLPPDAKISTLAKDIKIKDIKIGDRVLTAIGKGHTSVSKVIKIFKDTRETRLLTFETESGKKIEVTDNHKMFCFLPAHYDLKDSHFVYIMYHTNLGWRVGVTNNLPQRLKLERHADKIIGIGSYKTDEEARFFEAYYSAKYGIPTVPFTSRPGQAISGELLRRLFSDIDTRANIEKLADDLKIELDSPQFLVGAVTRGQTRRIKINFEMCARNYRSKSSNDGFVGNPWVSHRVSLETSNSIILKKLASRGVTLIKAKKGKRVRRDFTDLKKAWNFAWKLHEITGGIIDKRFKVGRFNYQHLSARIVPASHVFAGMYLPVLKGREIIYEKVISRREVVKTSDTYDLEIEKTHNFIANGIVVHNSIYRFRGAAISNIIQFRKNFPNTKVVTLIQNYRSTQEILNRAYDLIQHNNPDRLEVIEKVNKKLKTKRKDGEKVSFIHVARVENEAEEVAKEIKRLTLSKKYDFRDFAILVRANNHSEPFIRALQRNGIPYQFLGPGRLFKQSEIIDLISYLKVLYNFDDSISFHRILSLPTFNINSRDIAKLGNHARKFNLSLFETAEKANEINISNESKEKIDKIVKMVHDHLGLLNKESAGQILYYFLEETNLLKDLLSPENIDAQKKAGNISKFFDKLKTYEVDHENSRVADIVDWINLSMEVGESPAAGDTDWTEVNAVNILTVHSSKGLEFPVVFLVNLVAQRFPTAERHEQIPIPEELIKEVLPMGDYHLQEERRLFYVGMTRAKDILYLTAANFYGEGKREKKISPFALEALGKLPKELKEEKEVEQLSFLDYGKLNDLANEKKEKKHLIDTLSYSQVETFSICPLHYKLKYLWKVPSSPTAASSFGISIHRTLREFYEKVKAGEKPTEDFILKVLSENCISEGYESREHEKESFKKAERFMKDFFKNGFNKRQMPTLLEQSFMGEITRPSDPKQILNIRGTIDRVDVLPNGTIEIIDYKTGDNQLDAKKADKDMQLTFYALAGEMSNEVPFKGKDINEISFTLYYLNTGEKVTTKRTKAQLIMAKEDIFKIKEEIEKSDFRCSDSFICQMCEYKMLCQADLS